MDRWTDGQMGRWTAILCIHFSFLHLEFGIHPQTLATLVLPCFIVMFFFFKNPEPFFKHLALCYFLKRKSTGVVCRLLVLE